MSQKSSIDHTAMRDMNIALILTTLHNAAPLSRAALANKTGLNKATVSSMVKDMIRMGFIREMGVDTSLSEVGRPAINLEPNPDAGYMIGVEIGVGFISVITTNFAIEIVSRRFESTAKSCNQETIIERVLELIQESYDQVQKRKRPLFGIGIGVPGLVDINAGSLLFAPNLGWKNVPLKTLVESTFHVPVFVANEANLAALGESFFGAGLDTDCMVYISSGVGLGGGIVVNGRLLHGATGFAGEVGHMTVQKNGLACNCGNTGCWETVATQRALFNHVKEAVQQGQTTHILEAVDHDLDQLTIPIIVEAAKSGDMVAANALYKTGEWLGIGIASMLNIINPQKVIFGGSLSAAHLFLLPVIREAVARTTWHWVQQNVDIVKAKHGEDAAVMGGVSIVFQNVINNPREWVRTN